MVGAGGATQLATIDQLAPIYVYFNVDEQDVLRLRAGLRAAGKTLADVEPVKLGVRLQNETGYPHEATLDFVASDVDQSTGTLQARGLIENKDYTFLPGMFVRVQRAGRDDRQCAPGAGSGARRRPARPLSAGGRPG